MTFTRFTYDCLSGRITSDKALTCREEKLGEIAGKCRYSGGYAVLLARSFFAPQESYGQDAACGTEERNNQKPHLLSGEIRVCPNPADQLVLLQVENAFSNGVARVFNAQGKLLNAFEFQAPGTRLPVGNLANGIYFLDIRLDGKPGIRKSFVVNH